MAKDSTDRLAEHVKALTERLLALDAKLTDHEVTLHESSREIRCERLVVETPEGEEVFVVEVNDEGRTEARVSAVGDPSTWTALLAEDDDAGLMASSGGNIVAMVNAVRGAGSLHLRHDNAQDGVQLRAEVGTIEPAFPSDRNELVLGDTPAELVEASKKLLTEGLEVARRARSWFADVAQLDGAVSLLAHSMSDGRDFDGTVSDKMADDCSVGLLFTLAVWIGDQSQKLTGSEDGPDYSVMDLERMVKAALIGVSS